MNQLSARFHQVLDDRPVDRNGHAYRNALFHLLMAETSCFRYWGQGIWTEYGREICRRGKEILAHDFRLRTAQPAPQRPSSPAATAGARPDNDEHVA